MSHFYGSTYGYDEIDPFSEIPFTVDLASDTSGRVQLAARNEYPRAQAVDLPAPLPSLTERGIVRQLRDPGLPPSTVNDTTVESERFRGKRERFRGDFDLFEPGNLQVVLFFLLIMIIVVQIKIYTTMDTMIKLHMLRPGYQPVTI